jgi:hypothetical protein
VAEPSPDADYEPTFHRFSTPLMVSGIAVTAAAPVVFVLGAILSKSTYNDCVAGISHTNASFRDLEVVQDCDDAHTNRLYVLAGAAVVMAGAGVPMIIVGAHKVRDQPTPRALLLPYAGPQRAGLTLHVTF